MKRAFEQSECGLRAGTNVYFGSEQAVLILHGVLNNIDLNNHSHFLKTFREPEREGI